MALDTAKLVMTQVPCVELTPRSPAIAGNETFAIDVSSTFMKVAAESAIVPHRRAEPSSGGNGWDAGAFDIARARPISPAVPAWLGACLSWLRRSTTASCLALRGRD